MKKPIKCSNQILLFGLLALGGCTLSSTDFGRQELVFDRLSSPPLLDNNRDLLIKRERTAKLTDIDLQRAMTLKKRVDLKFNLFDDAVIPIKSWDIFEAGDGLTVYRGISDSEDVYRFSAAFADGKMTVDVQTDKGRFRVEPTRDASVQARYRIIEYDMARFPNEAPPLIPESVSDQNQGTRSPPKLERCDTPPPIPGAPGPKPTSIRILVLYTQASQQASASIQGDIALLIDQVDQIWNRSSYFKVRVELAGTALINYTATNNFSLDLNRLTTAGDGYIDEAEGLRNQYRADLVSLLVEPMSVCGIGWMPPLPLGAQNQYQGFTVVNRTCGLNNYSFAHELGHNFGMDHDETNVSASGGFNQGYIDATLHLRSVMAYENACTAAGYACPRHPSYSSPKILIKKRPFGIDFPQPHAAYNVEILCRSLPTVEQYRP